MNAKKTLLIFFLSFISFYSTAQDYNTAIGLRLGNPWAFSYKTFINERNAIEGTLGFHGSSGYNWVSIGGFYEHHTPIESAPGLSWYYGGGASIYFWSYDDGYSEDGNDISLGISGILGLDYKIKDTPLNISLDWTPTFFLSGYGDGFDGGYGSIGVRYVLK